MNAIINYVATELAQVLGAQILRTTGTSYDSARVFMTWPATGMDLAFHVSLYQNQEGQCASIKCTASHPGIWTPLVRMLFNRRGPVVPLVERACADIPVAAQPDIEAAQVRAHSHKQLIAAGFEADWEGLFYTRGNRLVQMCQDGTVDAAENGAPVDEFLARLAAE